MAVGKVVIGTRLDTKQLEKDLEKAKKQLEKFAKEEETLLSKKKKLELQIEIDEGKVIRSEQKIKQFRASMKDIKVGTPEYDKANLKLQQMIDKNETDNKKLAIKQEELSKINTKLTENTNNQKRLNEEIGEMERKLKKPKLELENMNFDNIGKSLTKVVKKVGKWALAVFGVRSAYSAVRSAMSTLSQYDDEMANNIQYITYALSNTLKPVIQWIINAVATILQYVNSIIQKLTSKKLFAGSKEFEKDMAKSSGSASKIEKSLAGFDEITKVSDSSSSSGGGVSPTIDLSQESLFAGWDLNKFIEKGKEIATSLAQGIDDFFTNFDFVGLAQGISKALKGIIQIVTTFIQEVDWAQVGYSIAEFLLNVDWGGIALDIINLLVQGLLAIGDFMIGVIDAILDTIRDPQFLKNIMEAGANLILGLIEGMISIIYKIGEVIKKIIELVCELFGIHSPSTVFADIGKNLILGLIEGIKSIIQKVVDLFSNLWVKIKNGASNAVQGIKNFFNSIPNFFSGIINKITNLFKIIGTSAGNVVGSAFKSVVNGVLKAIENILNTPIKAINGLIGVINKVPGINLSKLSTFSLPRLAKGGIINQPGRGVPVGYGQAIGGEKGQEGVLPLTDSQQMALLGEAIGRYVNINLTNVTKLDNRQIAKEQRRINAQNDFAFNR